MDLRNPTRFRPSTAADRFIAVFPPSSSAAAADEDLTEDDIFSSVDISSRSLSLSLSLSQSHNQNHISSSPSFPPSRHHGPSPSSSSSSAFSPPEASSSGILAALPDNDPHHIFNHKASVSASASASASAASSASSSSVASLSPSPISVSRLLPSVPRLPPPLNERFLGKYHQSAPLNVPVLANLRRGRGGSNRDTEIGDGERDATDDEEAEDAADADADADADTDERFLGKYHQSAPLNVPVLANLRRGRGGFVDDEFDEVEEEEEGEDEVFWPPHEIVARRSERLAFSVLEGAGRTLKGRDLRQVRNAVWRQTGFLD